MYTRIHTYTHSRSARQHLHTKTLPLTPTLHPLSHIDERIFPGSLLPNALQVMSAEGVQADVVIYNILLKEEASVEGVESVLAGMRDAHVAPNDRTYG